MAPNLERFHTHAERPMRARNDRPHHEYVGFAMGSYQLGTTISSTGADYDVVICNVGTLADPQCRLLVPERSHAQSVHQIRLLSGLTWAELATLFEVSPRSAHNWANGEALKPDHAERVRQALLAIQRLRRPSSEETRLTLLTPLASGERPLDLLKAKRWERAVAEVRALPRFVVPDSAHPDPTRRHPTAYFDALPDRPPSTTGRAIPGRSRRLPIRRP